MNSFTIFLVIVVVVAIIVGSLYMSWKRRKELAAWSASKGLTFRAQKDRNLHTRFANFDCFEKGSNRYAENIISGQWGSRQFQAFDFHYETHSHNSKGQRQTHHHHFSVAIIQSALPLKPLLIRPEGFFDKVTEFFGHDDIDFESAEFSKKFFVKATDRRWAFDVLHARAIQSLLDGPRFAIQFDTSHVLVTDGSSRFSPEEFAQAADSANKLLDQFPDYLIKQIKEGI